MGKFTIPAIGAVVLLVAAALALPLIVSTQSVTDEIRRRMEVVSGGPVQITPPQRMTWRPFLGMSYRDIVMPLGNAPGEELRIDEMELTLAPLSLLGGKPELRSISLVRPRLRLVRDAVLTTKSTQVAALADALATRFPEGTIRIRDGVIEIDGTPDASQSITAISGTLTIAGERSVAADMAGIWNGEAVRLNTTANSLQNLGIVGGAPLRFSLVAAPGSISFSGTVSTAEELAALAGDVEISSSAPFRLSQWLRTTLPAASLVTGLSLTGSIAGDAKKLTISDARVRVGSAEGNGRLEIAPSNGVVALSGTLAFTSITLPGFEELSAAGKALPTESINLADGLAMDIRLSAERARAGPLDMEKLAASLLVKDGRALLDVGDASALGGSIAGTVEPPTAPDQGFKTDLTLNDVDLALLSRLYGAGRTGLSGRGNARFTLDSPAGQTDGLLRRMNGSGSVEGADGTIDGVRLGAFSKGLDDIKAIDADGVFEGSTSYDALQINFYIANGILFFQDTVMTRGDLGVRLGGRADLSIRSLALQGAVVRTRTVQQDSAVKAQDRLPFLVGGTLDSPLFIALPPTPPDAAPPDPEPKAAGE